LANEISVMASEHGLQVETLPVALLLSAIASLPWPPWG
jgi:hypothetical protein